MSDQWTDETMDEVSDAYEQAALDEQARVRGRIAVHGADTAFGLTATLLGDDYTQVKAIEGALRAAYEAGRLTEVTR